VVDDLDDLVAVIDDARRDVGAIALGGDPLVPVAVRVRARLRLDRLEPRVLARRLVEVAVDADPGFAHGAPDRGPDAPPRSPRETLGCTELFAALTGRRRIVR